MTEQDIREIVEGHGLETCVGGYDELVSALYQKFQSELPRLERIEEIIDQPIREYNMERLNIKGLKQAIAKAICTVTIGQGKEVGTYPYRQITDEENFDKMKRALEELSVEKIADIVAMQFINNEEIANIPVKAATAIHQLLKEGI